MIPFRTYRNPALSLWQSSVAAVIKKHSQPQGFARIKAPTQVKFDPAHPMMAATIRYCDGISLPPGQKQMMTAPRGLVTSSVAGDPNIQAHLSSLHHQLAQAMIQGNPQKVAAVDSIIKKYSVFDVTGWLECVAQYTAYYGLSPFGTQPNPHYRNWTIDGKGNPNYSVIAWQVPANGKIAIIADWGTNQPEAIAVLQAACSMSPDAILNLGDTYYSGTPDECMDNVFAPISQYAVNPATGNPIPVFCLPGNHDYYSGGGGFYQLLDNLNTSCWGSNSTPQNSPQQAQAASYFCLRSADGGWQFLGMDTAYADHNALAFLKDTFEDTNIMPGLPPNEMDWHTDKLQSFTGKTILLSHHQLYSNNSGIGTPASNQSVNTILFKNFSPYFPNVGVWFWGHEHNLVVFDNVNVTISGMAAPLQLKKGRCVGHGAIPVDKLIENPYANNYPGIPVMPDPADPNTPPQPAYLLGDDGTWYNHGFEILQLHGKGSPINVTYYQVLPATGLPAQIGPGENI